MDNRRLMVATVVSALVLMVWTYLFPPPPPAEPDQAAPAAMVQAATVPATPGAPGQTSTIQPSGAAEGAIVEAATPRSALRFGDVDVIATEEITYALESPQVRFEISSRGALLKSALIKSERDNNGNVLDLIQDRGQDPYPYAILVDGSKSHALNAALFVVLEEATATGGKRLRFRHQSVAGVAEKSFWLDEHGLLQTEVKVGDTMGWGLMLGPGLDDPDTGGSFAQPSPRIVGIERQNDSEEITAADVEGDIAVGPFGLRWISLEDNYFVTATISEGGLREWVVRPVLARPAVEIGRPRYLGIESAGSEKNLFPEVMLIAQAQGDHLNLRSYYGSKHYNYLKTLPFGLENTVRWGYFGIVAKPLYWMLHWTHDNVVANFGWAIVLVTILIRVVFLPLTWRAQKASAKMQELSPKVNALRERYRSKLKDKQGRPNLDAQRQMNDEMMALYKTAGVSPVGGCLPILLQMPVFFAYFKVLSLAYELRQAPWIFWVQDLSKLDPYYILPILMGVTSLVLQRMSPQLPDPLQARMMQGMMVMFALFAFAFPSGLVLYWLTNNLLSMGQTKLMAAVGGRPATKAVTAST